MNIYKIQGSELCNLYRINTKKVHLSNKGRTEEYMTRMTFIGLSCKVIQRS